jgi:deoxyribose-phosphate aldolase
MDINELISKVTEEVVRRMNAETPAAPKDASIVKMVDHTLLKPDATREQVKKVCDEAKEYGFASVCVNPHYISYVAEQLRGSAVAPCCVIGFPLGATMPEVKAFEAETCIAAGAKELDMVLNVGAAKSGEWDLVQRDIEAVVRAARGRALVKVIFETCLLTDAEKLKACKASVDAGADFVKTSTGFSTGGATAEDVRLMRQAISPKMEVKASGGVRDYKTALEMVRAGATRLGTSSGVAIAKAIRENAPESGCINCGACKVNCPAGLVTTAKAY